MTETAVPPLPSGFVCSGVACGIKKKGNNDVGLLLVTGKKPTAIAMFTQNRLRAAPVQISEKIMACGRVRAIVVNSGNANACTGLHGLRDAEKMVSLTTRSLKLKEHEVLVCSTGIIGKRLPMEKVTDGIKRAAAQLSRDGLRDFTESISTTDAFFKLATATGKIAGRSFRITGVAKGAGMIHPNMATMLAYVMTDLALSPKLAKALLARAVAQSFNRISVDGDESTNDTIVFLSSGETQARLDESDLQIVQKKLNEVCLTLAKMIVRDGEGATKCLQISVTGARNDAQALRLARQVGNSPLVKTAFFGCDPNWGRIAAALGAAGVPILPQHVKIWIAGKLVFSNLQATRYAGSPQLVSALKEPDISVKIAVGPGRGQAAIYASDLTHAYVELNSAYHT